MNPNGYQSNPQGYQPNPQGYPGGQPRRPAPNPGCRPAPGQQPRPNGGYRPAPNGQPYQQAPRPQSRFTGGLLGLIGINIAQFLIVFLTVGLATPWAVCMKAGWITRHTIVDGHQLYFNGTGGQLFGNYIKWFLLTLITLGIYGFWLDIKMKQWVTYHTHMR